MANASIIAAAVAVLTIIACVVAIALNLAVGQGNAESLLLVPTAYTATFVIEWRDSVGARAPTGYTTQGVLAVDAADGTDGMSFIVHSMLSGARMLTTTFVAGLLYANSSAYNACVGAHTPLGLADMSQGHADSSLQLLQPADLPDASISCTQGQLYSISALYADHVLCIKDRVLQWAQGDSYLLTVTSFDTGGAHHHNIRPPEGTNMTLCFDRGDTHLVTQDNIRRLHGSGSGSGSGSGAQSLQLQLRRAHEKPWWVHGTGSSGAPEASRLLASSPRHVCFMHGMGQADGPAACGVNCADGAAAANMANNGADYWGNIASYVPGGAAYTHVIHVNTHERGWDYGGTLVQDMYYEFIKYYRCDVVFAHSMGNVILAALAARGKPVSWFMSQGPLRGSWGASWADSVCAQWYNPVGATAYALGYCGSFGGGGNTAVKSLGVRNYKTTKDGCELGSCPDSAGNGVGGWAGGAHEVSWSRCWHCSASLWGTCVAGYFAGQEVCADSGAFIAASAESVFSPYIKGRMCGSSAYGQGGINGVGLAAIAGVVGYGESNDGMVSMSSCAQASANMGQALSPYPTSTNYVLNGNHADGTCRSGEGAGGNQKACTWYKNMILRGTGVCPILGFCNTP